MTNSRNYNSINSEEEAIGLVNNHFIDLQKMNSSLKQADLKIQSALDKSKKAKEKAVHWYTGTTDVIESLQEASVAQAQATTDLYNAVQESHKVMIKMAKCNQKLFLATVSSAAYIRAVIVQLRKKLSKEQETLTEDAKIQLLNVICDLERQADIYDKFERLKGKVNNLQDEFSKINAKAVCNLALIEDLQNSIEELACQNNKQASELLSVKQTNNAIKSELDIINLNFSEIKKRTYSKLTINIAISLSLIAFILSFVRLII